MRRRLGFSGRDQTITLQIKITGLFAGFGNWKGDVGGFIVESLVEGK